MHTFYIVSTVLAMFLCSTEGQSRCKTPNAATGECVSITNCAPLLALYTKDVQTQQELNQIESSKCGRKGQMPKVCCPVICETPDGANGTCVDIYRCKHLLDMLLKRPPVTEELVYVSRHRCNGVTEQSVCCAPARSGRLIPPDSSTPPVASTAVTGSVSKPDPHSGKCGIESGFGNRIVGGSKTRIDLYPWMALIEYVRQGTINLWCGGFLISGKYVLTAAHCVLGEVLNQGTPQRIRLGEYDTSNDGKDCVKVAGGGPDCTDGILVIPIEQIIPHPRANLVTRRNDIALIRMKQMAPRTDFIRTICLPSSDFVTSHPNDYVLFVAGWGATETHTSSSVKLHTRVPLVEGCQAIYNTTERKASLWGGQICAGGENGKDSCNGDSGGPLMYQKDGVFEAIGIVSFGPRECGISGIPGVYTNVYFYLEWIRSNTRE